MQPNFPAHRVRILPKQRLQGRRRENKLNSTPQELIGCFNNRVVSYPGRRQADMTGVMKVLL